MARIGRFAISTSIMIHTFHMFVLLLVIVFPTCFCHTEVWGVVTDQTVWTRANSPYIVRGDIIVRPTGELTVEPGVEVRFHPGVGITVRGSLRAQGTQDMRIKFTRIEALQNTSKMPSSTVRLVDGNSVTGGRLQIYYRNKWRSVCSGDQNWTRQDVQVICNHLGFGGGEIYRLFEPRNTSYRIHYPKPYCSGSEKDIFDCSGVYRAMGNGVCDLFLDIGIQCLPKMSNSFNLTNWRGLWFADAKYKLQSIYVGGVRKKIKISDSLLEYVDVLYAGCNKTGFLTSAVEVNNMPPLMNNVTIQWSAYNGINISGSDVPVDITGSIISHNQGHGLFINTSSGSVLIDNSQVSSNGGSGIHYSHFIEDTCPIEAKDLCASPDLGASHPYPSYYYFKKDGNLTEANCSRVLTVSKGLVFTLHFGHAHGSYVNNGVVEVRNGNSPTSPLLTKFGIRNNSIAGSVVTTGNVIHIQVSAKSHYNTLVCFKLDVGISKTYDCNITNSVLAKNGLTGLLVDNMRSMLHFLSSQVQDNGYIGGIHVRGGAGDVNISSSVVINNADGGLNVSFHGGRLNVSNSQILSNRGNGISVWTNQSSQLVTISQSTTVTKSAISNNTLVGVIIGCQWVSPLINITMNVFRHCLDSAVIIHLCPLITDNTTRLFVTNNIFAENSFTSVHVSPVAKIDAKIEHNTFLDNAGESMYLHNVDNSYKKFPARVIVQENVFLGNRGAFVAALGFGSHSTSQSLVFTHNHLEDNVISEPFVHLAPRNNVAAVVVISSSNVKVYRNSFQNPKSKYDIGCRIANRNIKVNVSHNYLGSRDIYKIRNRLFDCKDRYNLACVNFQPYLLVESDFDSEFVAPSDVVYLPVFESSPYEIGGEVRGTLVLKKGVYKVTRDILVKPKSVLKITSGTVLQFAQSVGLMVQGKLHSEGLGTLIDQKVVFTYLPLPKSSDLNPRIRLVGGRTDQHFIHEGRLQVKINNEWGNVCNFGWSILNAALICHQMGLVLKPTDWMPKSSDVRSVKNSSAIVMSNVRCNSLHTTIYQCQYDVADDVENSCSHLNDVLVRCYEPTWAGIHFGIAAETSILKHTQIERAGLFDYSLNAFHPALQFDLFHHILDSVTITENLHCGLSVVFTDFYHSHDQLICKNSQIRSNRDSGIVLRSPGLHIQNTNISNNDLSGILYDPRMSKNDLHDILNSASIDSAKNMEVIRQGQNHSLTIGRGKRVLIVSDMLSLNKSSSITLETASDNSFGILVMSPIKKDSTEEIVIFDGMSEQDAKQTWILNQNISLHPITIKSSYVSINWLAGANPQGDAFIYVTAIERTNVDSTFQLHALVVEDSYITSNKFGIKTVHYNNEFEFNDWHMRMANQSVYVSHTSLVNNTDAAIAVTSKSASVPITVVVNNTFVLQNVLLVENGQAVVQAGDDLLSSTNVFNWKVAQCQCFHNYGSCFNITLPRVLGYRLNLIHSVHISDNIVSANKGGSLVLGGHFAHVLISDNKIMDNESPDGTMVIHGMEKELWLQRNIIKRNIGCSVVCISTDSHYEHVGQVDAYFTNNKVQENRFVANEQLCRSDRCSNCVQNYVLRLSGIQLLNATNNFFGNNEFKYNFVSELKTGSLQPVIDATQNWWGTSNIELIRKGIFGIGDSMQFMQVAFTPFLLSGFETASLSQTDFTERVNFENFGGRIYMNLELKKINRAYVIKRDLIVMPGAILTIEPGVILKFDPGVGVLVLGTIIAKGSSEEHIQMLPNDPVARKTGQTQNTKTKIIRACIDGNCKSQKEGFIEVFNATTGQWVPVCDDSFTENNAKVVCQSMFPHEYVEDVFVSFGWRHDMDNSTLSRVRTWVRPRLCNGQELTLEKCQIRIGSEAQNCIVSSGFTFVHCVMTSVLQKHWGGITISVSDYEWSKDNYKVGPSDANMASVIRESVLTYVDIVSAGLLHSKRTAAVQALYKVPVLDHVLVKDSAYHGLSFVAPKQNLVIRNSRFENNCGDAISVLSVQDYMRDTAAFHFEPMIDAFIPYEMFGMVDMCNSNKFITIKDRILLYYQYRHRPSVCIKIFKTDVHLGIRLIHLDLYSGSKSSSSNDYDTIKVFDGDISLSGDRNLLMEFKGNNAEVLDMYRTTSAAMSIQIVASGARESHGFIAEVFTIPLHVNDYGTQIQHSIMHCIFINNYRGAIVYSATGETNPPLTISHNFIQQNGIDFSHNFSSSRAAVKLDVQNSRTVVFQNNIVSSNQGGLLLLSGSTSTATALRAKVSNNIFLNNLKHPAIHVKGRHTSNPQEVTVTNNIVSFNEAPYSDILSLYQVMCTAKKNYIYNNTGSHILSSIFDPQLNYRDTLQKLMYNVIMNNTATENKHLSTVFAGSSAQSYHYNVLVNPINDFEVVGDSFGGGTINATHNWWGYNVTSAISGRIFDSEDGTGKIQVLHSPYLSSEDSLREGRCPIGWKLIGNSCHLYMGGVATDEQAKAICDVFNATVSYIRSRLLTEFNTYITTNQFNPDSQLPVRIQKVEIIPTKDCFGLIDGEVQSLSCVDYYSFLCEWGLIQSDLDAEKELGLAFILGISCTFLVLFVVVCVLVLVCRKRYRSRAKKRSEPQKKAFKSVDSSTDELSFVPFMRDSTGRNKYAVSLPMSELSTLQTDLSSKPSSLLVETEPSDTERKSPFSFSDDDSMDEDKKSLHSSQETLPLMESSPYQGMKSESMRRYLETPSLDFIDNSSRTTYLETSLDDTDV